VERNPEIQHVIPAKAGIKTMMILELELDSRLRGNDDRVGRTADLSGLNGTCIKLASNQIKGMSFATIYLGIT
jgi:hypothetical protein